MTASTHHSPLRARSQLPRRLHTHCLRLGLSACLILSDSAAQSSVFSWVAPPYLLRNEWHTRDWSEAYQNRLTNQVRRLCEPIFERARTSHPAYPLAEWHDGGPGNAFFPEQSKGKFSAKNLQRLKRWNQHYATARGNRSIEVWVNRGEALRDQIQTILSAMGLPKELYYVAMIESGFRQKARSRAHAVGVWQFRKRTARQFGLRINRWQDERKDPIKSTCAAALYLRYLHARFGDGYLALAAYNSGPGRVRKALGRGQASSYWELIDARRLPRETRNYVPKFLAAVEQVKNVTTPLALNEGFTTTRPRLPASFAALPGSLLLEELEQRLGLTAGLLKSWNPEILTDLTPPVAKNTRYLLRLPERQAKAFTLHQDAFTYLHKDAISQHTIKQGDTLHKISRRYGVSLSTLRRFNPGISPRRLRVGKAIQIPLI